MPDVSYSGGGYQGQGYQGQGYLGVFDSGVGGLSVLQELRRALPQVDIVYLADTAHVPYGTRSDTEIRNFTAQSIDWLKAHGAYAVVNACNTSSAFSLEPLRAHYGPQFPVVGLVPALKPAVAATKTGVVAVLATAATLRGPLLGEVITRFAKPAGVEVLTITDPRLVPLVEQGQATSDEMRGVLRVLLAPAVEAGADQLVLGCTHFPFLAPAIQAEFGDTFALLDSGAAVARHTMQVLQNAHLPTAGGAQTHFFATAHPQETAVVMSNLLSQTVKVALADAGL